MKFVEGVVSGGAQPDMCYLASQRLLTMAGVKVKRHQLKRTISICPP